ncbi:fish-egg lectin-like [Lampris incognitus]|uniref:fish-egg lectin-like n=1 Tax=Lampris incognitus TaxID=2546036 RepID=UPI0024B60511|nr:fish-egg lectin-like [Lampris incognitus]
MKMRIMMKIIFALALLALCLLSTIQAWSCSDGPRLYRASQIDAGLGQVVATDLYRRTFYLSSTSWTSLPSASLQHVTVGSAGIWGVTNSYRVYRFVAGRWRAASGLSLKQIDAGGDTFVVGTTTSTLTYCLRTSRAVTFNGAGSLSWSRLSGNMVYYSCGSLGCWGVTNRYRVYFTRTVSPTTCSNSGWSYISGVSMRMIEAGSDGKVFGVTTAGHIYERTGISSSRPYGTSWTRVSTCITARHVSYDLGKLWVVTTAYNVMTCTP